MRLRMVVVVGFHMNAVAHISFNFWEGERRTSRKKPHPETKKSITVFSFFF